MLNALLWVAVLAAIPICYSQTPSESAAQVPAGVHYKTASDAINSSAKDRLTLALTKNAEVPADFFDSAVTCGPGLWKVLQPFADKDLLNSTKITVVVNSVQVEARGLITEDQQRSFWKLLLTHYPSLSTATIRKARAEEIRYYWATIPFDIEEPLFILDDSKVAILVNFTATKGKPKLVWVDQITDLKELTAGPAKVINLTLTTTMAESGDIASMVQLGKSYLSGNGVPVDVEKAFQWLDRASQKGSLEAQMFLGAGYMSGQKLPKDSVLAFKYLSLVSQQQNVEPGLQSSQALAQYWLAMLYETGRGVDKSHDMAIKYLIEAANNGNGPAQFDLGSLYNNGQGGMPVDKEQAFQLFLRAADQGQVKAMHNVGYCYQNGVGVKKNLDKAVYYYTKSANTDNERSQHNLAMVYGELGDAGKTYFWLRVAQASGYDEKQTQIDTAKSHLSTAQVDQEEKEIDTWLNAHKAKQLSAPAQ
ncbi:MAG: tetratricopeptide repeat protein [Terracidiphilus sp.]